MEVGRSLEGGGLGQYRRAMESGCSGPGHHRRADVEGGGRGVHSRSAAEGYTSGEEEAGEGGR